MIKQHTSFQNVTTTPPNTSYLAFDYSSPYNLACHNPDTHSYKTSFRPCLYTPATRTYNSAVDSFSMTRLVRMNLQQQQRHLRQTGTGASTNPWWTQTLPSRLQQVQAFGKTHTTCKGNMTLQSRTLDLRQNLPQELLVAGCAGRKGQVVYCLHQ
jgi:hypothetical protein